MRIEVSTTVDRPVSVVWDFCVVHHVDNHPRWDPDLELEQVGDGPIGVGTDILRRNTRYGSPTEGTMTVTEFELERVMRVAIQDGPIQTLGWMLFAPAERDGTTLTQGAEFPGADESTGERIRPLMARSSRAIKDLIESET